MGGSSLPRIAETLLRLFLWLVFASSRTIAALILGLTPQALCPRLLRRLKPIFCAKRFFDFQMLELTK